MNNSPKSVKNKDRFRFWGVVGGALLIRILYALWIQDSWMAEDAGGYYQDALRILADTSISPFWPPGVPYFLAGWMWITGSGHGFAMMGMLLWYVLFCWSFAKVAQHWLKEKTIHILLLVFALYPAFIHHSVAPLSHLPVAVCLLCCVLLILRIQLAARVFPHQILPLLGIGVLLGLMGLFRPGAMATIPVVVGAVFLILRTSFRFAWAKALLPLFVAGVLIGGWEYSLYQEHQRWVGINDATAMNLFIGNNPLTPLYKTWWLGSHDETHNPVYTAFYERRSQIRALPLAEQKSAFAQEAWQHIQQQPVLFVVRSLNRLRCFFAFDTYTGARTIGNTPILGSLFLLLDAVCYLFLGFLTIASWSRANIIPFYSSFFVWILLAYSLPYLMAFSHPTYHFAILPLIGILGGKGLENRIRPRNWSLKQKLGMAIFAMIQIEWIAFMMS